MSVVIENQPFCSEPTEKINVTGRISETTGGYLAGKWKNLSFVLTRDIGSRKRRAEPSTQVFIIGKPSWIVSAMFRKRQKMSDSIGWFSL
ncbi:hypothetical protein HFK74_20200|uniref:hypothetical protein n=1 Tax=Pseudomonas sp. SbOxS1 TaxID=2723884 RepID=UPI0015D189AC|nr:hypothetical protein [Pseudomonas sp. SbOxS1]NYU05023.1 hypothetical protein [Pseudomonas sp. SbOxS1]